VAGVPLASLADNPAVKCQRQLFEWVSPETSCGERRGMKIESLPRLAHDNFSHNCPAGRNTHLRHDQSEKGLHCVGADVHPIRNLLAA
jgi:hypothetical protein